MRTHRKNVKRILVIAVVLVGVLVAFGIYNASRWSGDGTMANASDKTYTDSAQRFTFIYPWNWQMTYPQGGKDGPTPPEPDWSKVSRPVWIRTAVGAKSNYLIVTPGCTTLSADGQTVSIQQDMINRSDRFHTQTDMKINGYTGFYDRLDFKADAESYVDHTYFVTNDTDCVLFRYRENWHHDMMNSTFDDSKNMPAFRALVESITFAE